MKFKLSTEDEDNVVTTKEFEASTWPEALSGFIDLLRGSGYQLHVDSVGVNVKKHILEDDKCYNLATFKSSSF